MRIEPAAGDEVPAGKIGLRFAVADTGIGIPHGRSRPPLRGLRAGRRIDHAPLRRHRAGTGDRAAAGRADGRRDRRRQHVRAPDRSFSSPSRSNRQPPAVPWTSRCPGRYRAGQAQPPAFGPCAGGRGQPDQPEVAIGTGSSGSAAPSISPSTARRRWNARARQQLRPDPDGLPDAGDGRLRRDPRHPRWTSASP